MNPEEYLDSMFTFVNDFKSTRSGFNHYSRLHMGSTLLSEAKVRYINRTWEEYRYQTVNRGIALGCVLGGFTIGLALIITDIKKQLKKK